MAVRLVVLVSLTSTVKLAGDRVGNAGQLLPLLLEVLGGGRGTILIKPVSDLLDSIQNL